MTLDPSLTSDTDATIIQFPVREPVIYPDEVEPEDYGTNDLVDYDGMDDFTMDIQAEPDPDIIEEAGGRWVWEPVDDSAQAETPVGMVSHRIETMCRWTHRHLTENVPIPQECCYSVLISIARLPGPVREERNWLALQEDDS